MMNLETIYSSNIPIECHILKGRLETEGIPCSIFDENLIWVDPFYAVAIGGVKLKVPSDKMDQADEIIRLISNSKLKDDEGEYQVAEIMLNEIERQNEVLKIKSRIRQNNSLLDDPNFPDSNLIDKDDLEVILKDELEFKKNSDNRFKFSLEQFLYELFDFDRDVFKYLRSRPVDYYLDKDIVDHFNEQNDDLNVKNCPNCNSDNTIFGHAIDQKWDVLYLILSLLFMTPFFPFRKKHHCFNCRADFNKHKAG